jgi:hypothetical protein
MAKKSIDSDLGRIIREGLSEGKSRKQLFEELSEIYIDKSTVREQLVRTVDPRLLLKHRVQIFASMLILLLSFVSFFEMVAMHEGDESQTKVIIMLMPILIYIPITSYCIRKGMMEYTIFPFLFYINFAINFSEYITIEPIFFGLSLVLGIVYTIVTIDLRKKLLPHLTLFGPKRNDERQAIFE